METAILEQTEFTALPLPDQEPLGMKFLGTFPLGKEEAIATIIQRKINIKAIAFGAKSTKISKTENNLYGTDKGGGFIVADGMDNRLRACADNLFQQIVDSSFLELAWLDSRITAIAILTYSEDLEIASISAKLVLDYPDGDKYRTLSMDSGAIALPAEDIKPLIDEAIALVLAESRYKQTDLFAESEGDRYAN